MAVEFLYLDEPDMVKAGVLDVKRCVKTLDEMFCLMGKRDYLMGNPGENSHGIMLWFPNEKRTEQMPVAGPDRRFMAMPAFLGGRFNVCGVKWYGSNMENKQKGLPRSILTVMLNDVDTGAPIALMSANLLSSIRTGSVPGVATKYLQKKNAGVVGVVGAGVIGRSSLMAIAETIDQKQEVRVYDISPKKAAAFCAEMRVSLDIEIHPVSKLEEAVRGCNVVSVAAAGAVPVNLKDEWIEPGTLIIATGAVDLSRGCIRNSRVVFDNWKMHEEWLDEMRRFPELRGNLCSGHPSESILTMLQDGALAQTEMLSLGDIIVNPGLGRVSDDETIIFFTGGMGIEDVAWGKDIYDEAVRQRIGKKMSLWNTPHWT